MAAVLLPKIRRLLGRRVGSVDVFYEVPAVRSIPDIVVAEFDEDEWGRRQAAIVEQPDVMTLLAFQEMTERLGDEVSARALATALGVSPGHLAGSTLLRLTEKGFTKPASRGRWRLVTPYRIPVKTLVTIELKLRDWSGALRQASMHGQGADLSWVVLDGARFDTAGSAAETALPVFAEKRVGLSTLTREGVLKVASRAPSGGPYSYSPFMASAARALLAERLLELRLEGRNSGPEWPVFGRALQPSSAPN
ncbi:hypothetical protein ABZ652_02220 [Micromonospora chalcea]